MFGYRSPSGFDRDRLEQMTDQMALRGPDDRGIWVGSKGNIGFGHRRLSIIDLSELGHQPMHWADGRYTITFNGEIYNYQELREELIGQGRQFRSHSDTEVLLALFGRDGEHMCDRLRGMYAFAVYDEVTGAVFLARDPYGIKPLYYADHHGTFSFASTVRAVQCSKTYDDTMDPAGIVSFFVWGFVAGPNTLYKGIKELPAGHSMVVDSAGVHKPRRFFSLADTLAHAAEADVNQESMVEALKHAISDSVRAHMVADVPVGLYLSAGVDSTCLASSVVRQGLKPATLTLGFEEFRGTENDEVVAAEQVAACLGVEHKTMWVSRDEFSHDLADILINMDQPSVDGVNTYLVSKYARQAGFTVALSGLGGDEILGGYSSFNDVPKILNRTRWAAKTPWLGRGVRKVAGPVVSRFTSPKFAGLLEYGSTVGGAYMLRRSHFLPHELSEFLDPKLVVEGWNSLQSLQKLEALAGKSDSLYGKVALMEAQWYMQSQLLRDSDWAGMAHSIELRVPLVDIEVFKALAPFIAKGVPPRKKDLGECLDPAIKSLIVNRPKTGFSVPIRRWLMQEDEANNERSVRSFAKLVARSFGIPVDKKSGSHTVSEVVAEARSGTL
ncbi:MAG: asparagine synthase (glutamine-hydrolyzing) [Armatimonadetes bacterium]|nr:asparagine synthase (glutamine-hydrolyzing) [Armatimonadota bacterium]